jgi:hypothetical protein
MAALHGNLLGWQAMRDAKCTPGCVAASGSNFHADRPPIVEGHPAYPGMVHRATCRCIPVAPFPGARVLPERDESVTGRAGQRASSRSVRVPARVLQ